MQKTLLEIAHALYAEKGAKFSLSEIADAAGVSRPTVYKHLGDKAAILACLTASKSGNSEAQDIEERIMRGVHAVVTAQGFKAATIDAIADASGVGPATIYRRFTDKDSLIRAFISKQKPQDRFPDFPKGVSGQFGSQLSLIVSHLLHFMSENKTLVGLVFSGSEEDRAYLQALRDQSNSTFARLNAFFQHHQSEGAIRADLSAEDLTINLFGMIHAQAVIMPTGRAIEFDQVARSICQLFEAIKIGS